MSDDGEKALEPLQGLWYIKHKEGHLLIADVP